MDDIKTPPHSIEAEQSVLGGLMLDGSKLELVGDIVDAESFFRFDHQRIYRAIAAVLDQQAEADIVTVGAELGDDLEEVGGQGHLAHLFNQTPSAANIGHYARIVADRARRRRIIQQAGELAEQAYDADDTDNVIDQGSQALFELAERTDHQGFSDFRNVLRRTVENLDERHQARLRGEDVGVPTGLNRFDNRFGGFQPGDYVIVAGRPSMGKAQSVDTPVLAKTGWKRMGDLRAGDELASIDGGDSRVREVFPQGEKQLYRVTLSDGRSTEACAEHLWVVNYREWNESRVLETRQIAELLEKKRYQGRIWIDPFSGDFGHKEDLPIDPWALGVLLGDGSFTQRTPRISNSDLDLCEDLKKSVGDGVTFSSDGEISYRIRRCQGALSNPLTEGIKDLGLWGKLSYDKFVPEIYKTAYKDARTRVLRGLLDTDGWVEKWGTVRFASSSEQLADDVVDLARSIGAWATKNIRKPKYSYNGEILDGSVSWVCNIVYSDPEELFSEPFRKERAHKPQREKRLTVSSVTPSRLEEAQCIAVTHPSKIYITEDYIPTHNTALALTWTRNMASLGYNVAFFSVEMPEIQLSNRLIAQQAKVPVERFRSADFGEDDWPRITQAVGKMADLPIHIDASTGVTPGKVYRRARQLKRRHGLDVLCVDYLQLMEADRLGENRQNTVAMMSRQLAKIAKDLNVVVIVLCQLSRDLEKRNDKTPMMADLRESGSLEQDADIIIFPFRPPVYWDDNPDTGQPYDGSEATLLVEKFRNGPTGNIPCTYIAEHTFFGDRDFREGAA